MKTINFALIGALLLLYIPLQAQNTLSGTITDSSTGSYLEQVSIYFPQLEKGSITNESGHYEISSLPLGKYKVVASYLGFRTFSTTVNITQGNNNLSISLKPSAIEVEEVILSTPFHKLQRENVMKVEQARVAELKARGAITLADGITNIAGVSSVSTGIGIGKPVIRGLSSNRVVTYTQGVRLENQQFGDEHGLGISDAGISSIEIIKGPASLLYGSDALGGVLYLNPERFAQENETEGDVNLNYFSNTIGYTANAGIKTSNENWKFLLRGGYASHTDYTAGNAVDVTNSRFNEFDLKSGFAYQSTAFKSELRYNLNRSNLGIPEELGPETNSRTPDLPYQEISNHILSSKTSFYFNNASSIEAILGFTQNNRKEFEDHHDEEEGISPEEVEEEEEGPALFMKLRTLSYNLQYHLPRTGILETIIGLQGMFQKNINFGEEILIPDATTNDFGILATSHLHFNKSDFQLGLRYDNRSINSEQFGMMGEEEFIAALNRSFNSFNMALGYRVDLAEGLIARVNMASGFRAPNLAELTSNGTHEGTNRYEIGNSDLVNEKNIQTDFALEYGNQHFELFANGFYNKVNDFIYLQPDGTFIEDDPVFNYLQQDATLYGLEAGIHLHPHPLDWLHFESTFESVRGQLEDDSNIPLIPANSLTNTLRVEWLNKLSKSLQRYAFISLQSFFEQNKTAAFETTTPAYSLLNMGVGLQCGVFGASTNIRISANNILDKTYISHLSRLKPDGIANIGRNINLGISIGL